MNELNTKITLVVAYLEFMHNVSSNRHQLIIKSLITNKCMIMVSRPLIAYYNWKLNYINE